MASPADLIKTTLMDKWPIFVKYGTTKSCVFQEMGESDYVNGVVTKLVKSTHNVEIIFDKINATLVDGETVRFIDKIAIFPALALPVVPKINDLIVAPSLVEWEVKDVVEDPADAHYELRIRPIT